jgi:hypothetical protein
MLEENSDNRIVITVTFNDETRTSVGEKEKCTKAIEKIVEEAIYKMKKLYL